MTPEQELAAAIEGREYWRLDGRAALYALPGASATVRVQAILEATRRERYRAAVVRGDRAQHTVPCSTAAEAIIL